MAREEQHELECQSSSDAVNNSIERELSSLPPADGGREAWLFLFAAFMVETLLWGFPFSFGVLQTYYREHLTNADGIAAVGTTCTGIMYIAAPVMIIVFQRGPLLRKYSTFGGLVLVVTGLLLASLATEVWHLILTQGVIYAIGGGFLYYPILLFIDEWFIRRKSLAYGVLWAGSGAGGLAAPPILDWGLTKYGAATFMRGWAIALLIGVGPLLFFAKPRVPWSGTARGWWETYRAGIGFMKTRQFWILQAGVITQGLGYFIPTIYLPDYARSLGLEDIQQSALLSILNTASVFGVIFLSMLNDHLHVSTVILVSAVGTATAVFLFWGLSSQSTSMALLAPFSILYGFFAGGFTATFSAMAYELQRVTPEGKADLGSLMGVISLGRGLGNVISGPISEAMMVERVSGRTSTAYASSYSPLVIFTGLTAIVTFTPWVSRRMKLL